MAKSKAFLSAYGQDLSEGESDAEEEVSDKARGRRIMVAKVLGVTSAQLNSCIRVF